MNSPILEKGIRRLTLSDPKWGEIKLLRPTPNPGPWGVFGILKGTEWEPLVPVVKGEDLSHALHGYLDPLMQKIGRSPEVLLRRTRHLQCLQFGGCILADSGVCHPCPSVPDCYTAPHRIPLVQRAAAIVVLGWAEGRYVLVAEGSEFVL